MSYDYQCPQFVDFTDSKLFEFDDGADNCFGNKIQTSSIVFLNFIINLYAINRKRSGW